MSFSQLFEQLTGFQPFPWQESLYSRFNGGSLPSVCNIPTGLGKTSILAIWLIARLHNPKIPRRLVYIVNRRTVVDQTTNEAVKLRNNARKMGIDVPAISTLRGQFVDNGEWFADPSRPAIICGTVDMIGSRLLFNGYRSGFKSRPLHAGFLGQDALIIHDEAHLEPSFQELLGAILREQERNRELLPFHVMELTATSRNDRGGQDFQIQENDLSHPVVRKRINATKSLEFEPVEDDGKQAEKISEIASGYSNEAIPVLVFARRLEDVFAIQGKLKKTGRTVLILTGTLRGKERDGLPGKVEFKRFLKDADPAETTYLVCTSAGEVGIDISAARLVCDLSTFESMAQRFGRLNRYGEYPEARITIVHPTSFEANAFDQCRAKTLDLLRRLPSRKPSEYDASPMALGRLDPKERSEAFSPKPEVLPATDILFDAWSLTTLRGNMPGRPPVEPYLHGLSEWEPPESQVAWRQEVEVIQGGLLKRYPPEEVLEEYPLKAHELLRDQSSRIMESLQDLARRSRHKPVWLVDENGKVTTYTLGELANPDAKAASKKALTARIKNCIIVLPPSAGGLSEEGILDGNSLPVMDIADAWLDEFGQPRRKRGYSDEPKQDGPSDMALVFTIDRQANEEEQETDDSAIPAGERYWHWYVRPRDVEDATRASLEPVLLSTHSQDVRREAEKIVGQLNLPEQLGKAVILAAQLHDVGKSREIFQLSLGNPKPEVFFAKSGKSKDGRRWKPQNLGPYRHEFGSVLDALATPSVRKRLEEFDEDIQDLLLHLIAAHHGRARPGFPPQERFDWNHPPEAVETLASETIRRFSHLQRKFGRWGLAYLESLVRAADWAASAPFYIRTEEPGAAP